MPAELHFWHPDHLGAPRGRLTWRHVNVLNTPIVTSAWLANGAAVNDVYEIVFTRAGAAVSATVTALIHAGKNPYHRPTVAVPVVADGAASNNTLIPGVGIVLAAGTDTGWRARVAVGNGLDDAGAFEQFFGFGIVEEGTATAGKRVAVRNVGADAAANTTLFACPGMHWTGAEDVIKAIGPHLNPARHRLATPGSRTITFSDFKDVPGGGGKKSCDIMVNGQRAVNDAVMDGQTVYQYGVPGYDDSLDLLRGLHIILHDRQTSPVGAEAALTVAESGYTYLQVAADSGGVPGPYSFQDLVLTQAGQTTGVIAPGGAAFCWVRFAPPEGAGPGPIRAAIPRLRCLSI